MKRSFVAATAVALLLTGCATGETGYLDPEIDPDLSRPIPAAEERVEEEGAEQLDAGRGDDVAIAAGVEQAFAEATASEGWAGEVTTVYRAPNTITLTTLFTEVGPELLAACEAGAEAARSAGISEPRVEVLTELGQVVAELDVAAGDEVCAALE